jgi:hypothetical protein
MWEAGHRDKPCGQLEARTIKMKRTVRSLATVIGAWLIATFSIRVVPVVFLGVLRSKMPFDMVSVLAVVVVFVWVQVGVWPFDPAIK